jgi:hypothetical protein
MAPASADSGAAPASAAAPPAADAPADALADKAHTTQPADNDGAAAAPAAEPTFEDMVRYENAIR